MLADARYLLLSLAEPLQTRRRGKKLLLIDSLFFLKGNVRIESTHMQ
jgi:hypothetical protein